jgi:hypothetical protein
MTGMKKYVLTLALAVSAIAAANAQHEHHQHQEEKKQPEKDSASAHEQHEHGMHDMHMMNMTHAYSRNLPMSRNGSGTSWSPDESPMLMYMAHAGKTSFMFHGNIFVRYNAQDVTNKGNRGGYKWDAPNWFMGMMNTPVGKRGLFNVSLMVSLDRPIMGGAGYPLLFQSGETWKNRPLIDRQHPHDFISGLSVGYTHMINKDIDVFAYLGYPGEPALGATAFMHRISSMNNPDAPLGHHWQDATHITFGVGTLGFRYKKFKVEGSVFTGREPDENRYDFDKPLFDSYSYRVSYNPSAQWALQFSQGFVHSPEALEPEENVVRTSASAMHVKQLAKPNSFIATTGVWGFNNKDNGKHKEHSALLESNLQLNRNTVYGRYEFVEKSTHELQLEEPFGDAKFSVHALTLGYNRALLTRFNTTLFLGAQGTVNFSEKALHDIYGQNPLSAQVYLRISPAWNRH